MSAFGRGRVRGLLRSSLGAVAVVCAAGLAVANPLPVLSPEAPPSFSDLADAIPLVAVFTAARGARDLPPSVAFSAEPKFALAPGAESAPRERLLGAICRCA